METSENENLEWHDFRCPSPLWKLVETRCEAYPDRWENESQFVRASIANFLSYLDREDRRR